MRDKKRNIAAFALMILAGLSGAALADDAAQSLTPTGLDAVIRIWPNQPAATRPVDEGDQFSAKVADSGQAIYSVSAVNLPSLSVYLPKNALKPTAAVVICPGGAYRVEMATSEGHAVAQALAERGIAAFVLKYRLPTHQTPTANELPLPQRDAMRAVQVLRDQAKKWNLDPAKIGIMGFSAGGHLAATAATMYGDAKTFAADAGNDAASQLSARPDFAILAYPVVTMKQHTHIGSRTNLLGENPGDAVEARFSAEDHVTAKTPPLFVTYAFDDNVVPTSNSQMLIDAATKAGVPNKLLTFRRGGHGFGLGHGQSAGWLDQALAWLASQKLIDPPLVPAK